MWSRIIPQIAFDSEVVLNPMLALSALHLHAHSPGNAPMSLAISRYLDRTLVNHREALQSFDGKLTEQVWLSAILLSNIYWLLAHQQRPDEPYELPFHGWRMMHGVTTLFLRRYSLLTELGYEWYGHVSASAMETHYKLSFDSAEHLETLKDDLADLMQRFEHQSRTNEEKIAYSEAQAYVIAFYRAYLRGTDTRVLRMFIGTMPIKCPPTYLKLLERHDPLAMAIMARLLVLLVPLESAWWINGIGDYEVVARDIRGIYELIPEHLRWCMDWPRKVLSGEIDLNRQSTKAQAKASRPSSQEKFT
ncbi:hypothetical protein TruAng_005378 [Truncatella angustata]|nr:hypothetical protein TruAng_005378 [Truncatella angustata]